jgi:hypothetical protein
MQAPAEDFQQRLVAFQNADNSKIGLQPHPGCP